jgi:predicted hydrocarbon binding protein
MIRDTFESNPGLCELFKRKILERARSVGVSEDIIDFESQIDLKGTYQDNLRIFYRQYPQLSQDSDYFRIKSNRGLSGAALEQSWLAYVRNNGYQSLGVTKGQAEHMGMFPELVVTYSFGTETAIEEGLKRPDMISAESVLPVQGNSSLVSNYGELIQSILDSVTAMAGEKVTMRILHHIGQDIGRASLNSPGNQILSDNPVQALNRILRNHGWGRLLGLDKSDQGSSVTYTCTIIGCHLCEQESNNSTCSILRGIVSHWLESLVQGKAERIETACGAAPSEPCVFRVTFRK